MIKKLFDENQSSILRHCIDVGATSVDEISEKLITFGELTTSNKMDALMSVYSMLLNGNFNCSRYGLFDFY